MEGAAVAKTMMWKGANTMEHLTCMGTVLRALYVYHVRKSSQPPDKIVVIIILILQLRKLRHRE